MSSSHMTLKEFVRPVSTCQQEVTLETVLALVRSSQYTTNVIVDRQHKPIGVLDYRRLLSLVAENWLNCFTPSVGSDRLGGAAALAKGERSRIFTQRLDLNSLKEPIVSLSSQMGVEDFLSYLKAQQKTNESSQHYTLVDVRGKLLGLLDVPCLLETLLWNWQNTDTKISQNLPYSHWFFELLEQIPLPPWTNYQDLPTNCSQKCWLVLATRNYQTRSSRESAAKDAELSELNRLKDELLASISHELKSPLTAIVGLSNLLKEQKLGTLNQRQLRYTELIYHSGRQLMNIVNDLLDWSRLATGKLKLNLEPVKIKTICEEVYQQVISRQPLADRTNEISYSNPRFKLNIEPGLETIAADRLRLCQIVTHLLDNAFKSTAPEGEVGISVTLWTKWVAIIVWDTGRGISEVSQPLVLKQFFQPETSSVENGAGLGLVLAQQLAEAHGGDISFISRVGIGSEFTLLLPYHNENYTQNLESEVQAVLTDESICDRQINSLILVVEAVSHRINNLVSQLKELGYHPIIARTATEALHKARQLKPSKILLNSSFSLVSGDNILTLLKSDLRTAHIPVWLTVEGKPKQEQKCARVDGVLSLPIDKQILARVFSPIKKQSLSEKKSLTILRLYPGVDAVRQHSQSGQLATTENYSGDFGLNNDLYSLHHHNDLYSLHHRVIEADSLEQGEILAGIWQLDVILLDGSLLPEPLQYLHSLKKYESLAALPLVTLDAKTTRAANQVEGLSVFPCLVPADERSLTDLAQVIQIATGIMNQVSSEQ